MGMVKLVGFKLGRKVTLEIDEHKIKRMVDQAFENINGKCKSGPLLVTLDKSLKKTYDAFFDPDGNLQERVAMKTNVEAFGHQGAMDAARNKFESMINDSYRVRMNEVSVEPKG